MLYLITIKGTDLYKANITDENILICPRHGWKFDLSNKGISQSSDNSINALKSKVDGGQVVILQRFKQEFL